MQRHSSRVPGRALVVVGAAALASTAAIALLPSLRFAYQAPQTRMALETTAVVVGLFAALLLAGRFLSTRLLRDFALALGLSILVLSNLCFSALPAATGTDFGGSFTTWSALIGRLLGLFVFASSVFLPERRVSAQAKLVRAGLAGAPALLALVALTVFLAGDRLPEGFNPPPQASVGPELDQPAVSSIQLVALVLSGVAAFGLAGRARQSGDAFLSWLALGSVLSGVGSLNYFLYPSLYSEWIYTGDLFRLGAYLVFLGGSVVEIRRYWAELTRGAVLEERRRIARGLHDSVAQELAYIGRRAARLPAEAEREAEAISGAARRALVESRRTIEALARDPGEPLDVRLRTAVETAAERGALPATVTVDPALVLDPDASEALALIASEAVTNAARHAHATRVVVDLSARPTPRLTVVDDGCGFDPRVHSRGYGLRAMRERAAGLGGSLRLTSAPGTGTTIEVGLP